MASAAQFFKTCTDAVYHPALIKLENGSDGEKTSEKVTRVFRNVAHLLCDVAIIGLLWVPETIFVLPVVVLLTSCKVGVNLLARIRDEISLAYGRIHYDNIRASALKKQDQIRQFEADLVMLNQQKKENKEAIKRTTKELERLRQEVATAAEQYKVEKKKIDSTYNLPKKV